MISFHGFRLQMLLKETEKKHKRNFFWPTFLQKIQANFCDEFVCNVFLLFTLQMFNLVHCFFSQYFIFMCKNFHAYVPSCFATTYFWNDRTNCVQQKQMYQSCFVEVPTKHHNHASTKHLYSEKIRKQQKRQEKTSIWRQSSLGAIPICTRGRCF